MRLLELRLTNFQGIKSCVLQFGAHSASVYGDNATGKTTIFNAATWLLFGKSSTGSENFTPKTNGPDEPLHFLDHTAEGIFETDNGGIVALKKVYREVYKKRIGGGAEEFDGHTVDHYIDGVPVKKKEYTETLSVICGGNEKMKLLTMPEYFSEALHWIERRKILLDICGDVDDSEVIAASQELKGLPATLIKPGTDNQYYTVDEYRKIAASKKSDINEKLSDIPGRIDEAERATPDTGGPGAANIEKRLMELASLSESLSKEKAGILAGDTISAELRVKISEATARLAEARAAHIAKAASANEDTQSSIENITRQIQNTARDIDCLKREKTYRERSLKEMTGLKQTLHNEYNTVFNQKWNEAEAICPTCNRELPPDDISKMREEFNINKSRRLSAISERGRKEAGNDMIEELAASIDAISGDIKAKEQETANLNERLEALKESLIKPVPFESTNEYAELTALIASSRDQERDAWKYVSEATASVNGRIRDVFSESARLLDMKSKLAVAEAQACRINELKRMEKALSAEFERLENGLYLCNLFTKTKVNMLTKRVNLKFKSVGFRLFEELQNGSVQDGCEVMIPDADGRMVPYADANNAARINAGLEIIDVLSKHFGLKMPVFIDNAESVTRLNHIDTQVIRLVVSKADAVLRLEVDPREIHAERLAN